MEKSSEINTFINSEEEGKAELDLTEKKLEKLSEKHIKKENREFILKMNLSKNQFYEITDDFLDFRNLVCLDMTENYLENITNLHYLVNLEILILAKNFISDIGNVLSSLQNLQFLDLCFNKLFVNDLLVKNLAQNKNLFSLSLRGNLNYHFEKVKIKCLELTENLEILDTVTIFHKRHEKIIINNTVDYKTKKGEKVKIKTLKDYMNVRIKDLEENKDSDATNNVDSSQDYKKVFFKDKGNNKVKGTANLKDSYVEEIKARVSNKKLHPKSFYYFSNSLNINHLK